jgi:hypothetical protein
MTMRTLEICSQKLADATRHAAPYDRSFGMSWLGQTWSDTTELRLPADGVTTVPTADTWFDACGACRKPGRTGARTTSFQKCQYGCRGACGSAMGAAWFDLRDFDRATSAWLHCVGTPRTSPRGRMAWMAAVAARRQSRSIGSALHTGHRRSPRAGPLPGPCDRRPAIHRSIQSA